MTDAADSSLNPTPIKDYREVNDTAVYRVTDRSFPTDKERCNEKNRGFETLVSMRSEHSVTFASQTPFASGVTTCVLCETAE